MSLLSDKILEDVEKLPYHSKKDFMADYCEKYGCSDTDRAEELKAREDLLILAVKMMKGKSAYKKFKEYVALNANKHDADYLQLELHNIIRESIAR
ncbi:MAG: hypothetical protein WC389_21545 [Lutibacter sp.]|jgi:hypothetical protein